jgi:hypothetical protein
LLRLPYGLERLPRYMALDDPRLRCTVVTAGEGLRLNSEPVPADAMPLATGDHAARVGAATDWLCSLCGDYAPLRRQFVAAYFNCIAAHLTEHRAELAERVKRYDGVFAPEDFLWSALRPLPRGWIPVQDQMLPADMVFWDGARPMAIELATRDTERQKALQAGGVAVYRIEPGAFDRLDEILPASFRRFWDAATLPSSPFRRPLPPLP